jgi:hypothetical protein
LSRLQALLSTHGFDAGLMLVNRGMATAAAEKVRAGVKTVDVVKVWITDVAGRYRLPSIKAA